VRPLIAPVRTDLARSVDKHKTIGLPSDKERIAVRRSNPSKFREGRVTLNTVVKLVNRYSDDFR
jgi:hypothetical protein